MEINYEPQEINARMGLEEALKAYANEIQILTLKDGTNIEIIQGNQKFRSRPGMGEMGYTDNQLGNVEENDDEFIEENFVDNYNQYNYQQITPTKQNLLRGKGQNKGLGKSLRKTVLRSIDGKEQEKQFENGLLKNLKSDKKQTNVNNIISFTESNEYLQCANCNKFFCSDEEEKSQIENKAIHNNTQNNQKIPNNAQQLPQRPQQNMPYPQQFQPLPQQPPYQPKQNPRQQQNHHQGQQIPHNPYQNQNIPYNQQKHPQNMNMNMGYPQKQNIPHNQQKIPQNMNMNMGYPQKNNPQGFFQQPTPFKGRGPQQAPKQQQFYQQNNIHNPQMAQFRGNNQVFRARKREVNDYEEDEYYDDNIDDNNYITEEIYYYPSSSKKFRSEKKVNEEFPIRKNISHNIENRGLTRNLSFGFKKKSNSREIRYIDNNQSEYANMNDNLYYEYPDYYNQNDIPTGNTKQYSNHRVVNVKVTKNTPYQYQENDDYEDYYY